MKIQVILLFRKIDKVFFGKFGHMKSLARSGTICTIYKKREKHPWSSVTFSKLLVTFSQLYKWYQIIQRITYTQETVSLFTLTEKTINTL